MFQLCQIQICLRGGIASIRCSTIGSSSARAPSTSGQAYKDDSTSAPLRSGSRGSCLKLTTLGGARGARARPVLGRGRRASDEAEIEQAVAVRGRGRGRARRVGLAGSQSRVDRVTDWGGDGHRHDQTEEDGEAHVVDWWRAGDAFGYAGNADDVGLLTRERLCLLRMIAKGWTKI